MTRSRGGRAHDRRRSSRSTGPFVATVVLGIAMLTGCVAPALDSGAFQHNALEALDSAVSQTRTAALEVQNLLDHRVPKPYADTVVTGMEKAIGPVQDSFGSVDPPTQADERLRDQVTSLLSDADDALAQARIALRKDDTRAMDQSVRALRAVADRMERESGRLQ